MGYYIVIIQTILDIICKIMIIFACVKYLKK